MELGTVHLSQACSSHRLIVELLEELTRQCLEVFKEQLIHLARMTLESLPGLQRQAAPSFLLPIIGLTSRKPRVRALSSNTRNVWMYSGGSRWLKEHSP